MQALNPAPPRFIEPSCHFHPTRIGTWRWGGLVRFCYICDQCHSILMQNKKANLAAYRARQATRQAKKQDTHLATLQRIKAKIKSATIGNYLKWPKAQPGATIIFRRDGKLYSHNNETNETTHYTTQQVKQLLAHGKAILIEANQPF